MFWVLGFSAFAVFLGIAAGGFLVLILSFFMGELFDFGDHSFAEKAAEGSDHGSGKTPPRPVAPVIKPQDPHYDQTHPYSQGKGESFTQQKMGPEKNK